MPAFADIACFFPPLVPYFFAEFASKTHFQTATNSADLARNITSTQPIDHCLEGLHVRCQPCTSLMTAPATSALSDFQVIP